MSSPKVSHEPQLPWQSPVIGIAWCKLYAGRLMRRFLFSMTSPRPRTVRLTFTSGITVKLLVFLSCWLAILIPLNSALIAHALYSEE